LSATGIINCAPIANAMGTIMIVLLKSAALTIPRRPHGTSTMPAAACGNHGLTAAPSHRYGQRFRVRDSTA
jgi:hypothetical protein